MQIFEQHIIKMNFGVCNLPWIAASLGTISLVLTLIAFPLAYRIVRLLEVEIDHEKEDFKTRADMIWTRIIMESAPRRLISKRQIVQLTASCPSGRRPLTRENGLAFRCSEEKVCPDGWKCTGKFGTCCPVVLKDEGLDELPNYCNCDLQNKCPLGPPGPDGQDGSDGNPGLPGSDGELGLEGEDLAMESKSCPACPAGPPGRPGEDGPSGKPGLSGNTGVAGRPGPIGNIGSRGMQGPSGAPGPRGNAGPTGTEGLSGSLNRPGVPGNKGESGAPGAVGNPGTGGVDGEPGVQGRPGNEGLVGESGAEGSPGVPGRPGESGNVGNDAQYCGCPPRTNRRISVRVIRLRRKKTH